MGKLVGLKIAFRSECFHCGRKEACWLCPEGTLHISLPGLCLVGGTQAQRDTPGSSSWGALFNPTRAIGQRYLVTGVAAWGLCRSCPGSTEEAFSFSSLIHMWAVTFPWLGNQPFSLQKQGYFARAYLLQASVSKFSHERNLCWVPRSRVTGKTAPSRRCPQTFDALACPQWKVALGTCQLPSGKWPCQRILAKELPDLTGGPCLGQG